MAAPVRGPVRPGGHASARPRRSAGASAVDGPQHRAGTVPPDRCATLPTPSAAWARSAALRIGSPLRASPGRPLGVDVQAHGLVPLAQQGLVGLPVAVEGPHQHRVPEGQVHALVPAGGAGVPGVPGLAVGVHQLLHQRGLHRLRQSRGHQLAGEHLVVVGVPVRLLLLRQRVERPPGDDALHPDGIGVPGVAVEQHALQQVVVDHPAVVVGLHLHVRFPLGGVEPDDVDVEVLQRRGALDQVRALFQDRQPGCPVLAGGPDPGVAFLDAHSGLLARCGRVPSTDASARAGEQAAGSWYAHHRRADQR